MNESRASLFANTVAFVLVAVAVILFLSLEGIH